MVKMHKFTNWDSNGRFGIVSVISSMFILCLLGACAAIEKDIPPTFSAQATQTRPVSTTPVQNLNPTITPTQILNADSIAQSFPTHTPTSVPVPSSLPTPTPGPPLTLWYQDNGQIYRYNLQTWDVEEITLPLIGTAMEAKISPNGEWLAYLDKEGLKYMPLPQGNTVLLAKTDGEILPDDFVFSPDGHSLAYMEEKGLFIADLPNNTRSLLWENDLEKINQDPPDITLYVPVSWSADQDWLVIWTSWWEGGRLALGSITSKNIFPLSGCSDTSWSPNGATLGMVVRYSGYLLCGGDNDGIYVVETTEGEIEEKLIYQESSLSSPPTGLSGAAFIQWSPDGHLMFVQENENLPQSSLILLSPDGTEINTLVDLPTGRLLSPIWSNDSKRVYFIENIEDTYTAYEFVIDSFEKRLLFSTTSPVQLLLLSPDGDWLMMGNRNSSAYSDIYLVNLGSNAVVQIASDTINGAIGWQKNDEN